MCAISVESRVVDGVASATTAKEANVKGVSLQPSLSRRDGSGGPVVYAQVCHAACVCDC